MARANALPPDARRASIIAATLPLLRTYGRAVTTSQIAMAAGVAEGTLFRVFSDKEAMIAAAIGSAFDPKPSEDELERIDRSMELRDKLIAAVEIIQRRIAGIWQLIAMLQIPTPPPTRPPPSNMDDAGVRAQLESLFEPHRAELRCEPDQAARLIRALAFSGSHPRMTDKPLTAHEIVSLLLDGIRARPDAEDDL
ncbi:MAG TPA: helix-turn-helix domain-containing protein [Kofleriaceae bacterium]|nr:helix-turn-helix domain-containing protein [Kofleriaceae bacterium]